MSGVLHVVTDGGAALGTDADPNTTAPVEARIFEAPSDVAAEGVSPFVAPVGGTTISVRLWVHDRTLQRWIALGSAATVCATDRLTLIEAWSSPAGLRYFAQVTANTGVTKLGIGFLGSAR